MITAPGENLVKSRNILLIKRRRILLTQRRRDGERQVIYPDASHTSKRSVKVDKVLIIFGPLLIHWYGSCKTMPCAWAEVVYKVHLYALHGN